jgi:hypothetical protein
MVLTLVGVTPGGFNVDSDCKVVVNSSSAAMVTSTRCQTRNERKESPAICDTAQATRLCGEIRDNKHAQYSSSHVNGRKKGLSCTERVEFPRSGWRMCVQIVAVQRPGGMCRRFDAGESELLCA